MSESVEEHCAIIRKCNRASGAGLARIAKWTEESQIAFEVVSRWGAHRDLLIMIADLEVAIFSGGGRCIGRADLGKGKPQ